jgi:hypothetical protein
MRYPFGIDNYHKSQLILDKFDRKWIDVVNRFGGGDHALTTLETLLEHDEPNRWNLS